MGKLDAWIDGKVPESIDQWFARTGNPTPTWPWSRETRCGPASARTGCGYFGQWSDGVWPSLIMLPSAFDGGIDEVALWETALPDEVIVQHYQDALAHRPYSTTVKRNSGEMASPPADPPLEFDMQDYPPGTLLPTPPATGCGAPHCAGNLPGSSCHHWHSSIVPTLPLRAGAGHNWAIQKLGNCMNSGYLGGEPNTSVINAMQRD